MKTIQHLLATAALLSAGTAAWAQIPGHRIPPRTEDHFQRKLVVNRVDLTEKINEPLIAATNTGLYGEPKYAENNGLVAALMNGLQSGKYLGYNPDSLTKTMTYEDVLKLSQNLNAVDEPYDPEEPFYPDDPYNEEESEFITEEDQDNYSFDGLNNSGDPNAEGVALAPLESSIEFIENRIFDKNRSAEIYDIQYIRLVWVDPGETLPDKNFVCFKFSDVLETLEATRWANRHNDAEDRNLREIFEERLFNGFVLSVSGSGARTLPESAHRSQQMLEFEHHLWNF